MDVTEQKDKGGTDNKMEMDKVMEKLSDKMELENVGIIEASEQLNQEAENIFQAGNKNSDEQKM